RHAVVAEALPELDQEDGPEGPRPGLRLAGIHGGFPPSPGRAAAPIVAKSGHADPPADIDPARPAAPARPGARGACLMADEIGHLPRSPGRMWLAAKWSLQGLRAAWLHESSFRLEVYLLAVLGPLALV